MCTKVRLFLSPQKEGGRCVCVLTTKEPLCPLPLSVFHCFEVELVRWRRRVVRGGYGANINLGTQLSLTPTFYVIKVTKHREA